MTPRVPSIPTPPTVGNPLPGGSPSGHTGGAGWGCVRPDLPPGWTYTEVTPTATLTTDTPPGRSTPEPPPAEPEQWRPPDSMVEAVRRDLAAMGPQAGGVATSLMTMALWLAEVIDDPEARTNVGQAARLAQELRTVLLKLSDLTRAAPEDVTAWQADLATPTVDVTPDPNLAAETL